MPPLPFVLIGLFIVAVCAWAVFRVNYKQRLEQRATFINAYRFPASLRGKLVFKYSQLTIEQIDQVIDGLRQFFLVCLSANVVNGGTAVGMPSKVVDELWHQFILMSREYSEFCDQAFGKYLHHTPDTEMKNGLDLPLSNTLHQLHSPGLNARMVGGVAAIAGVPLLFAMDRALGIEGGYQYDASAVEALELKRKQLLASRGSDGGGSVFDGGAFSGSASSNNCSDSTSVGCSDGGASAGSDGGGGGGGGGCGGGGDCGSS